MAVNALYLAESEDHPVSGGYIQPGPGVTAAIVTLSDTGGVSLTGAAGTGSAAVLTVQGNASGTAIPVSGTVTASGVAQGSTTSGQTGGLTQAAVTTADPTYTTAQTSPLSLTTGGGLRTFNKQYRDAQITAQVSSSAAAPGAGGTVATVTPGTAGLWEISGTISISGTTVAANETNNMQLRQTSTVRLTNIPIGVNSTTGAPGAVPFGPLILNLSGVDTVNIIAVNAGTGSSIYGAQILCRLVG
jgi:hypothetical protein